MQVDATSKLWKGESFYDCLCFVLDSFFLKIMINKFHIKISWLSYVQNIPIVLPVALVTMNLKKKVVMTQTCVFWCVLPVNRSERKASNWLAILKSIYLMTFYSIFVYAAIFVHIRWLTSAKILLFSLVLSMS